MNLHLKADLEANHHRFIKRAVENDQIWFLASEEGPYNCESYQNDQNEESEESEESEDILCVVPFWSDEAYAARALQGMESKFEIKCINIDFFINDWVYYLHSINMLAGTNWNADFAGLEIEPLKLRNELIVEMIRKNIIQIPEALNDLKQCHTLIYSLACALRDQTNELLQIKDKEEFINTFEKVKIITDEAGYNLDEYFK